MADISKIKLVDGTIVNLKDAKARQDFATLLGANTLAALEAAAWKSVDAAVADGATGLPTTAAVKDYVDSQVQALNSFDVQVVTALPTAGADTMYILYLIHEEGTASGTYTEYVTIRSGSEGAYTYAMERIGTTAADLSGYVKETRTVAGKALDHDITVEELSGSDALNLGALSHKDDATGTGSVSTIDSITMDKSTVAGDATVTSTETTATISAKAAYTPAGKIQVAGVDQSTGGDVLTGGSIDVTLKDSANKSEATLTTGDYTPAGTVEASISEAAADEAGFTLNPTISKPGVELTSEDKSVLSATVQTAGTLPSLSAHTGFDGGKLEKGDAVTAAKDGLVAHVASGAEIAGDVDAETLVFAAAETADVMSHDAAFTPAVYGQDNFDAGNFPVYESATVKNVTGAALDAAPTFSAKLKVSADFTGTAESGMKISKVEYVKQEVDEKTFTPTKATLGFAGTEAADLIPTEVKYEKADGTAAFSVDVTPTVKSYNRTDKDVEVTVS